MVDSKFVYWAGGVRHEVPIRPVVIHNRAVFQRVDKCAPFHSEDILMQQNSTSEPALHQTMVPSRNRSRGGT
jgi:hypothetical protein